MSKIGILGGTFNPIHLGHTLPAKEVAEHLSLDKVLLIPANIPPHKATPNISAHHRSSMVKLACSDEPIFICDERELKRNSYSYTIDTLKELSLSNPSDQLYFIMGLDSLLTFTSWYKYQDILSKCHLIVNTRPNYQLDKLNKSTLSLLQRHQVDNISTLEKMKHGGIYILTDILANNSGRLNINLSSTELRQRLINNQCCETLLSQKVLDYINKNKLYR